MSQIPIEFPLLKRGSLVGPLKRIWSSIDLQNMAVLMVVATLVGVGTSLTAVIFIKTIESDLGRKDRERWGPREIDIDILLFNDEIILDNGITIPHNEILKRDFVLIPLIEIDKKLFHPGSKKLFSYYLKTNRENHILGKAKIDLLN